MSHTRTHTHTYTHLKLRQTLGHLQRAARMCHRGFFSSTFRSEKQKHTRCLLREKYPKFYPPWGFLMCFILPTVVNAFEHLHCFLTAGYEVRACALPDARPLRNCQHHVTKSRAQFGNVSVTQRQTRDNENFLGVHLASNVLGQRRVFFLSFGKAITPRIAKSILLSAFRFQTSGSKSLVRRPGVSNARAAIPFASKQNKTPKNYFVNCEK